MERPTEGSAKQDGAAGVNEQETGCTGAPKGCHGLPDMQEYDSLVKAASQLNALLMILSACPQALRMLPDSAQYDALCLACDLSSRVRAILGECGEDA